MVDLVSFEAKDGRTAQHINPRHVVAIIREGSTAVLHLTGGLKLTLDGKACEMFLDGLKKVSL